MRRAFPGDEGLKRCRPSTTSSGRGKPRFARLYRAQSRRGLSRGTGGRSANVLPSVRVGVQRPRRRLNTWRASRIKIRAHWRLWRDRVWAARQSLANVEHALENPPRPTSEQFVESTDVEAARSQLTHLEAVLRESLVALTAIADEMASYRETHLPE